MKNNKLTYENGDIICENDILLFIDSSDKIEFNVVKKNGVLGFWRCGDFISLSELQSATYGRQLRVKKIEKKTVQKVTPICFNKSR